eukprot:6302716-Amphidinium_carterae.1
METCTLHPFTNSCKNRDLLSDETSQQAVTCVIEHRVLVTAFGSRINEKLKDTRYRLSVI